MSTPMSLSSSVELSGWLSMVYVYLGLLDPKCMILHLSLLNDMPHFLDQVTRSSMAVCILLWSTLFLERLANLVSSANFLNKPVPVC